MPRWATGGEPGERLPRIVTAGPADRRLLAGHSVDWLLDAAVAWPTLLNALGGAKLSLDIQLYALHADPIGDAFVQALVHARQRGVHVRLVLDGIGSSATSAMQWRALVDAGVQLGVFGPVRLAVPWRQWLRRNHRKVLVIDAHSLHIGGRNVGNTYYPLGSVAQPCWLDAGVVIHGPVVAEFIRLLQADWQGRLRSGRRRDWLVRLATHLRPSPSMLVQLSVGRKAQAAAHLGPPVPLAAVGTTPVGMAVNHGSLRTAVANTAYTQAIKRATTQIWLASAYFLPGRQLRQALLAALRRGVQVRLLLPSNRVNDVYVAGCAMIHGLTAFMHAGAQVRLVQDVMLHAKFGIVDGVWWTVGSANLDRLSLHRNLEANVVGSGDCEPLVVTFEQWWQAAQPWTLQQARALGVGDRLLGWFAWQLRWAL